MTATILTMEEIRKRMNDREMEERIGDNEDLIEYLEYLIDDVKTER